MKPRDFYQWRRQSLEERLAILAFRQQNRLPWHSPPHFDLETNRPVHISAACYEHQALIGQSAVRLKGFSQSLLDLVSEGGVQIFAWCVLPNHYHLLVQPLVLKAFMKRLGAFHGRTAWMWNGEDNLRGRKVFHRATDRAMRSERHFWTTMNYVHHNPVRHGYARKWQQWPWSSAASWLESVGRTEAERIWTSYPVRDYGRGWDEPQV